MEFRTVPPDPSEFPRLRLLWPPALLALLLFGAWVAELNGHIWNIHAEGALLLGAFVGLLLVGTVSSVVSLATLVPALGQHSSLRTRSNLTCTAISLAFVVLSLLYLAAGLLKRFNS